MGEIADQWIELFEGLVVDGKRRRSTLKDYTRHLTVDLAPLRSCPAKTLTHPEVSAAIEEIEAERGGSEARAARATLSEHVQLEPPFVDDASGVGADG